MININQSSVAEKCGMCQNKCHNNCNFTPKNAQVGRKILLLVNFALQPSQVSCETQTSSGEAFYKLLIISF